MTGLHAIIPAAGMGRRMADGSHLPKSLRAVAGRPILLHALDALAQRGVSRITLVVGHGQALIREAVGAQHANVPVHYAVNEDYASTEHGWSLYLSKASWQADQRPVLFMDADNVFEPPLLRRLLDAPAPDRIMVDPRIDSTQHDEELVLGRAGRVLGFVRGRAHQFEHCVGGFVGIAIEMKRTRGGTLSPEQKRWRGWLTARGWLAIVAKGADDGLRQIDEALKEVG